MIYKRFASLFLALSLLGILPGVVLAADEPSVSTRDATDVKTTSVVLHGRVDGNGSTTNVWFEYGRDRGLGDTTSDRNVGSGNSNFSSKISDLTPGATYYFRAVAENDEGIDYGSISSLKTLYSMDFPNNDSYQSNSGAVSQATTLGATNITSYSVQLNSSITNRDGNFSNSWFEWGTTPSLGYKTVTVSIGPEPEVRHADILTGLRPGTLYYFRAVAENSYWRNIGTTLSFVTGPGGVNVGGGSTVSGGNTTIIIEQYPSTVVEDSSTVEIENDFSADDADSSLGASAGSTNYFLPQNLLSWMVLIVLFLTLVFLVRHVLRPKPVHVEHTPNH